MALIGCDQFHYAVMKTEDTVNAAPTYDDASGMKAISGLIKLEVQPTTNSNTLYADNAPLLTTTSLGEINVNLEAADIPLEDLAAILGHAYDKATKKITYKGTDVAPYVAIAFAAQKNDGNETRFVKLFKGKFSEPNDDSQTQGSSVEFKTPSVTGKFVVLKNDSRWKEIQDADTATAETIATTFFGSVLAK